MRKSTLFLLELILGIFIFSIASAICIQLFVKAHTISKDTTALNAALVQTQNAAAVLDSSNGSMEALKTAFPKGKLTGDTFLLYFDAKHQICEEKDAAFSLHVTAGGTDSMLFYDIYYKALENGEIYYRLPLNIYIQQTYGEEDAA